MHLRCWMCWYLLTITLLEPILLVRTISLLSSFSKNTLLPRHVNPRIGVSHGHDHEEKAVNLIFSYEKQNNQENPIFCHRPPPSHTQTVDCCIHRKREAASTGSVGPAGMNYPHPVASWHGRHQRKCKLNGRKKKSKKKMELPTNKLRIHLTCWCPNTKQNRCVSPLQEHWLHRMHLPCNCGLPGLHFLN